MENRAVLFICDEIQAVLRWAPGMINTACNIRGACRPLTRKKAKNYMICHEFYWKYVYNMCFKHPLSIFF